MVDNGSVCKTRINSIWSRSVPRMITHKIPRITGSSESFGNQQYTQAEPGCDDALDDRHQGAEWKRDAACEQIKLSG